MDPYIPILGTPENSSGSPEATAGRLPRHTLEATPKTNIQAAPESITRGPGPVGPRGSMDPRKIPLPTPLVPAYS